jgi:hypothetical protein
VVGVIFGRLIGILDLNDLGSNWSQHSRAIRREILAGPARCLSAQSSGYGVN